MTTRCKHFFLTSLFGVSLLAAGCAARGVDVSHRGPIEGKATVEGDTTSARGRSQATSDSDTERSKRRTSDRSSDSVSGSGSASGSGSSSSGY
jgi:hypothetical protein